MIEGCGKHTNLFLALYKYKYIFYFCIYKYFGQVKGPNEFFFQYLRYLEGQPCPSIFINIIMFQMSCNGFNMKINNLQGMIFIFILPFVNYIRFGHKTQLSPYCNQALAFVHVWILLERVPYIYIYSYIDIYIYIYICNKLAEIHVDYVYLIAQNLQ